MDRARDGGLGGDAAAPHHVPVLVAETVALLAPVDDRVYVDATVGLGGHSEALLETGAGRVIGLDRDRVAIAHAGTRLARFGGRMELVHRDYRALDEVLDARGLSTVHGVLADLGASSMQLDEPARGFSFRHDGPLDMRMNPDEGEPLAARLAAADETTLADVIYRFGEERHARRVARAIVAARAREPITRTGALAAIVRRAAGGGRWQRLDPATRTFQALRIWVNDELGGLDRFLETAPRRLAPDGRLAVIAFHSLEDRVVKHTFRALAAGGGWRVVTKTPVRPTAAEQAINPRARSARLRVLERTA